MTDAIDSNRLGGLIRTAKRLAREYRDLTGRPLGIAGEVGEYEACRLLGLMIAPVREAGFDATGDRAGKSCRYQIKTRCIVPGAKPGQRIGRIDLKKECDAVLVILLDQDLEPTAIYEASWMSVADALRAPGSKARNERGALGLSKFKSIGELVWSRGR